jgi:hypothetical protein
LKAHFTTSYSTCELHVVQNLELAHYVDRLRDENDGLRKTMGWLSGHEPQLRMMIEVYKHYDGQRLVLSGILPGYSCEEGGRVEDGLLLEFLCTPTRTRSV